jgi:hypothetical protein
MESVDDEAKLDGRQFGIGMNRRQSQFIVVFAEAGC